MSWNLLHTTNWTGTVAAPAAGVVLQDGWRDIQGGIWSIASGVLKSAGSAGVTTSFLARQVADNTVDQRFSVAIPQNFAQGYAPGLCCRWVDSSNFYLLLWDTRAYSLAASGNTLAIYTMVAGTLTLVSPNVMSIPLGVLEQSEGLAPVSPSTSAYRLEFCAEGTSPTHLTGRLINTTTGQVQCAVTYSDSTAALQVSSSWAVTSSGASTVGSFGSVLIYNWTSTAAVSLALNDANIIASPGNVYSDASGAMGKNNIKAGSPTVLQLENEGAYLKVGFNGTMIRVAFDTSKYATTQSNFPVIRWRWDSSAWHEAQLTLPGSGVTTCRITLTTDGLASGAHTLMIGAKAFGETDSTVDRWNQSTTWLQPRITAIQIDSAATSATPANVWTKKMLVYGDSVTGCALGADPYATDLTTNTTAAMQQIAYNSFNSWVWSFAAALGYEHGTIGTGGQGFNTAGIGNTPNASTAYPNYHSGASRLVSGLLSPMPDLIVVNHGHNDNAVAVATLAPNVVTMLSGLRTAAPNVPIVVILPFGGYSRASVTAGFNAVKDNRMFLVDVDPTALFDASFSLGVASWMTFDGSHPNVQTQGWFGAMAAVAVQKTLFSPAPRTRISIGDGGLTG